MIVTAVSVVRQCIYMEEVLIAKSISCLILFPDKNLFTIYFCDPCLGSVLNAIK